MSSAERFKTAFSYKNVKVHFVGAWYVQFTLTISACLKKILIIRDTVSSIGITRGTHMLPRTVNGMAHVCHFRHALALDERRVKFLPEYAYGGSSKWPGSSEPPEPETHPSDHANKSRGTKAKVRPQTLEVWFAGTHSDM